MIQSASPSFVDELAFTTGLMSNHPFPVRQRWANCRSGHKFRTFYNKKLVVYRLLNGHPQILDSLTCLGIGADFRVGVSSLWKTDSMEVWVSHTPIEVVEGVFLWHPPKVMLEYISYNDQLSLQASISYRTETNPATLTNDKNYILELSAFNAYKFGGQQ